MKKRTRTQTVKPAGNPARGSRTGRAHALAPQVPRYGIHTSVAGGVERAAERAHALGCTAFQIFSSSPRQWKATCLSRHNCSEMQRLRARYDLRPLAIHDSYLINLASRDPLIHARSAQCFRGELERALALKAEYLVMHPGAAAGDGDEVHEYLARSIAECARGLKWDGLTLLIENTAGGATRLGGTFESVADIMARIARQGVPVGACIDTCHCWVCGYDVVSEAGYEATLRQLDATIGLERVQVIHTNDAKCNRGSRLDRHQHIGEGQLGREGIARWLRDPRLADKAFILETPIDAPGDDARNVRAIVELLGAQ